LLLSIIFLEKSGWVIGRMAAFIDDLATEFWQEPIGLFGYFESPSDEKAANILLSTAGDWLKSRNMRKMPCPWSFAPIRLDEIALWHSTVNTISNGCFGNNTCLSRKRNQQLTE
jgi:hypothetical protein